MNQFILILSLLLVLHVWRNFGGQFCPPPSSWGLMWDCKACNSQVLPSCPSWRQEWHLFFSSLQEALSVAMSRSRIEQGIFDLVFLSAACYWVTFNMTRLPWSVLCWKLDEEIKTALSDFKIFGFEITHNTVKSNAADKNTAPFL